MSSKNASNISKIDIHVHILSTSFHNEMSDRSSIHPLFV